MVKVKGFDRLIVTALVGLCFAQPVLASLSGRINAVVNSKSQSKTRFAIMVVNADSGKMLYDRNILLNLKYIRACGDRIFRLSHPGCK